MCKDVQKGEWFSVIKAFPPYLFIYSFTYLKYASTFFLLIKIHDHLSSVLWPGASQQFRHIQSVQFQTQLQAFFFSSFKNCGFTQRAYWQWIHLPDLFTELKCSDNGPHSISILKLLKALSKWTYGLKETNTLMSVSHADKRTISRALTPELQI